MPVGGGDVDARGLGVLGEPTANVLGARKPQPCGQQVQRGQDVVGDVAYENVADGASSW